MAYKISETGEYIIINNIYIPSLVAKSLFNAMPNKDAVGAGMVIFNPNIAESLQSAGVIVTAPNGLSKPGPAYDDLLCGLDEILERETDQIKPRFSVGDTILIREKFVRRNHDGEICIVVNFPEDSELDYYIPALSDKGLEENIAITVVEMVVIDVSCQYGQSVYVVRIADDDEASGLIVLEHTLLAAQYSFPPTNIYHE